MRRHARRRVVLALLGLSLAGCGAGWQRVEVVPSQAVPPRQIVQVWHDGVGEQWHGVVVTADSISGIAFIKRLDCDSCRHALFRAEVDSLRFGDPATPGVIVGLAPIVALLVLSLYVSIDGGLKD